MSTKGRNEELVSHECNLPENLSQRIDGLVNKVIAIEKLKETRVFCRFTRLSHVRSETGRNPQEQLWEKIPVKIKCIVFNIFQHKVLENLQHRKEKTGKTIPEHVIEGQFTSFEQPTMDEGFDEIIEVELH